MRMGGAAILVLCALFAWRLVLTGPDHYLYMALIMGWGLPVLALQWAFGGHVTWKERILVFNGLAFPTLFLWLADALAIEMNIWSINSRYLLGIYVGTLPVEEMIFFTITNLMVLQGSLLFVRVSERMDSLSTEGKKGSQSSSKTFVSRIWQAALRL
eukprot:CAMPEP_0179451736 /NCGR_PEP_ID=MMETSP0799-20121207/35809_1 /TAXON_ID=46947 /ORGANISM="Geminigera cryophila, Strain CCMP2564" /LENGTH=156 /DNA_ID=CAMNT_0021247331 /DNA_START=208 /DNA_END=678 /DNA_ORIENTATION=-